MSMSGQRRLELERARMEELRLAQVTAECEAMLAECDAAMRSVRDVAVQQHAADALRASARELRELRERLSADPDAALGEAQAVSERLHQAITQAEAKALDWTGAQAEAVAAARHADVRVRARSTADRGLTKGHEQAQSQLEQASAKARSGDLEGARVLMNSASETSAAASVAAMDERVRREVVKGLLKTLKGMGFISVGPQLSAGLVVLEGRLASGRKARFEVKLDGEMAFDLDGYEGRACAADMEKVEIAMKDQYGVSLGPPQVVWKNPDRLSKGAKDLPTGGATKRRS